MGSVVGANRAPGATIRSASVAHEQVLAQHRWFILVGLITAAIVEATTVVALLCGRLLLHRADLVANTFAANPAMVSRQSAAMAGLMSHGYSTHQAQQGALGLVDASVMRQGSILAYNDASLLILKPFIVIGPVVLVLRKPSGHGQVVDAH